MGPPTHMPLRPPALEFQAGALKSDFYMGAGDWDSSPQAGTASALPSGPSHRPAAECLFPEGLKRKAANLEREMSGLRSRCADVAEPP